MKVATDHFLHIVMDVECKKTVNETKIIEASFI